MRENSNSFQSVMQAFFERKNCLSTDVGLLQPAEPFLDSAGEDFRRLMFLTSDETGETKCLRPEFTIPVCLQHIKKGAIPVRYGYCGTVFRQRRKAADEFIQAGIEDLGNDDRAAADIAAIVDCMDAITGCGVPRFDIVIGDQAVFTALLIAMGLPKAWREKLTRYFGDRERLSRTLEMLGEATRDPYDGLPEDLVAHINADEREAVAEWIAATMVASGLPLTAGRTPESIASRLMNKVELATVRLDERKRTILEEFLSLETPIDRAAEALHAFQKNHDINLGPSLENLAGRLAPLCSKQSSDISLTYRAGFGRRLDYYTGMIFEIFAKGENKAKPLAGGGRYDRLMSILGAETTIPAVGFSIWADRIGEVAEHA